VTDKLCCEEIPLIARIIAVADSFDAMTMGIPYRKAIDLKRLLKNSEVLIFLGKMVPKDTKGSRQSYKYEIQVSLYNE
jgi:hypothetical protein